MSTIIDCTRAPGRAPTEEITCDVCVVGGGMAGLCAAISAARHGARVVLLQDRAVLGGNASSEVRMWICGAHGADNKETGLLEEIQLENCHRNQQLNYCMWDHVLYAKAAGEARLDLRLSCAVTDVETVERRIHAVRAWHLTAQRWLRVCARQFIDCSGDSILRLSGAACRWGREARADHGESLTPEQADRQTMGNSILIQLREIDEADHQPFVAPEWAAAIDEDALPGRPLKPVGHNFWFLELGGEEDTIADADAIRDRLLAIAYGAWAYIKNHPDGRGRSWELEWIGSLPGKRENVRYLGDHVLTQDDIQQRRDFPDIVAYGGWTMDDHPPGGWNHPGQPTQHHPAPSPYGIPYRCLYSRDIANLSCAGRNISATHMALSSTRVMATCSLLGQAAGTGAAIAAAQRCDPREVYQQHLVELQTRLADDDQWLPTRHRARPPLLTDAQISADATLGGTAEALWDGHDRALGEDEHAWCGPIGSSITIELPEARALERVRIVADSNLRRCKRMPCSYPRRGHRERLPLGLLKDASVSVEEADGRWRTVAEIRDNRRRLIVLPLAASARRVRLTCHATWASLHPADADHPYRQSEPTDRVRLFGFEVGTPDWTSPQPTNDWPADRSRRHAGHA